MLLLSWNVAGRKGKLERQLEGVTDTQPDVVALQEVTLGTYPRWREGLMGAGYSVLGNLDLVAAAYPPPPYDFSVPVSGSIARTNFNLTASRLPIAQLPGLRFLDPSEARYAFPEKYLVAEAIEEGTAIEIHNAHAPPGSSRGIIKPQAFRAMRRRVDERPEVPQILCGDFNTPVSESDDDIVTASTLHPGPYQQEWDDAERGVLCNPRLPDAYASVRRQGEPFAVSHRTKTRDCRYDRVYASKHFSVTSCDYISAFLDERVSDHAPVLVDLQASN